MDGDVFIIAVRVKNAETKKVFWQIDKVIANCDGESFYLINEAGEAYDDWQWCDVDYFIRVDAYGPMTRNQLEVIL